MGVRLPKELRLASWPEYHVLEELYERSPPRFAHEYDVMLTNCEMLVGGLREVAAMRENAVRRKQILMEVVNVLQGILAVVDFLMAAPGTDLAVQLLRMEDMEFNETLTAADGASCNAYLSCYGSDDWMALSEIQSGAAVQPSEELDDADDSDTSTEPDDGEWCKRQFGDSYSDLAMLKRATPEGVSVQQNEVIGNPISENEKLENPDTMELDGDGSGESDTLTEPDDCGWRRVEEGGSDADTVADEEITLVNMCYSCHVLQSLTLAIVPCENQGIG